ncbi:hypothetical protein AURDEDRAFT_166420 [Auricularia subglabra TFB-10046 SS5]|uniref:Uncharacterized protein n=1 Tax=Auricularia subglabra (strain TFB-10046 / SS5) TaxID=717982 RepID=J0LKX2_AURST|nr:hypothetical protein AURDEDRAFT_166420 [Auricularia subglabra TFB-10046 SS5]
MSDTLASPNAGSLDHPLELPPDCYAAHLDELPKPGSRILGAQAALAAALVYNATDPDVQKELENLREDISQLAAQNENLSAYSQLIYDIAYRSRQRISELTKQILAAERHIELLSLVLPAADAASTGEVIDVSQANRVVRSIELQGPVSALERGLTERTFYKAQAEELRSYTAQCNELRSERDRLVIELRNQVCQINDEISYLTCDKDVLQRQLDDQRVQLATLKTGRALLCEEIRSLRDELDTQRAQLEAVVKERDSLKSEREAQGASENETQDRKTQMIREITAERNRLYCYLVAAHELTDNLKERLRATNGPGGLRDSDPQGAVSMEIARPV